MSSFVPDSPASGPLGHLEGDSSMAAGLLQQSRSLQDSAGKMLSSARGGGFAIDPHAGQQMVTALTDAMVELEHLNFDVQTIGQNPKLGGTPGARQVSPFMALAATDERGMAVAVENLKKTLDQMADAYRAAMAHYDATEQASAQVYRKGLGS